MTKVHFCTRLAGIKYTVLSNIKFELFEQKLFNKNKTNNDKKNKKKLQFQSSLVSYIKVSLVHSGVQLTLPSLMNDSVEIIQQFVTTQTNTMNDYKFLIS